MSIKSRPSRFSNILDCASGQLAAKVALNRNSLATAAWRELKAGALIVATVSLCVPPAQAGTGDLDPSFADHGRLGPISDAIGSARSIELLDEGRVLVGGGAIRIYPPTIESPRPRCTVVTFSFAKRLGEDGAVDEEFEQEEIASVEASDFARQADGSIVAAGGKVTGVTGAPTRHCLLSTRLTVYRLASDGSLDSSFGTGGVFEWSDEGNSWAYSIALEPDGRIVVAGANRVSVGDKTENALIVLRLLSNGDLDQTFGVGGVYVGPAVQDDQIRIARTAAGSYRVSAAVRSGCAILGLTPSGALHTVFGDAGIVLVSSSGELPVYCDSLALLPNDGLLVAGGGQNGAFVSRLLADGAPDPTFTADTGIADFMTDSSSIIAAGDGKVLVAGSGHDGASIMRLLSSGQRDTQFGDAGVTWIDLHLESPSTPIVRDMAVREDGSVVAVGAVSSEMPFVVRLIGDDGGRGPGIVSFLPENYVSHSESDGPAIFRVRRRGGSDGDVRVSYRTTVDSEASVPGAEDATSGADFKATTGTLHWPDGDTSEREIAVEIMQDDGPAEGLEAFFVELDGVQDGSGIGTRLASVSIEPDGSPAGQIKIIGTTESANEADIAGFLLAREYYFSGRVCVTLTPVSGTAKAGEDFNADASDVCWDDQDTVEKLVEIEIIDDKEHEDEESFTVELSAPTGGALIATPNSETVSIAASDVPPPPPPPPPPSGGGGPAGVADLLVLLGLLLARQRGLPATGRRGLPF